LILTKLPSTLPKNRLEGFFPFLRGRFGGFLLLEPLGGLGKAMTNNPFKDVALAFVSLVAISTAVDARTEGGGQADPRGRAPEDEGLEEQHHHATTSES
jgi:hypothetical protein